MVFNENILYVRDNSGNVAIVVTSGKNRSGQTLLIEYCNVGGTVVDYDTVTLANTNYSIYMFKYPGVNDLLERTIVPFANVFPYSNVTDFYTGSPSYSQFHDCILNGYNVHITMGSDGTQIYTPSAGFPLTSGHQVNVGQSRSLTTWNSADGTNGTNNLDIVLTCMLGSTKVLTLDGYKPIMELTEDDAVVEDLDTMKTYKVKKLIVSSDYTFEIAVIPQNYYKTYPINDLHISTNHPYWINGTRKKAIHNEDFEKYEYIGDLYNIAFEKHTTFIAEGMKVDSVDPSKYL